MINLRALKAFSRRSGLVAAMMAGGAAVSFAQQAKPADTVKKAPPATQSKTTPPATQSKTTPPATQSKTTPPATQSKTTPPATQSKTTPPATQSKTTPPATQSKTTPPATQSKTTPPATQSKTTPPATQSKTTPPAAGQPNAAASAAGQTKAPVTAPQQNKGAMPPAGQTKAPVTAPQQAKGATPNPQAGNGPRAGRGATGLNVAALSDTAAAAPLVMMREVFDYSRDGRRDPFLSLLATTDLRPTLGDLRLLMTVVDEPGRSVALLQDAYEKKQKTVRVGSRLGRMRVTSIRADAVVFTIEEFGANRRDSLLLRDSTKVRGR